MKRFLNDDDDDYNDCLRRRLRQLTKGAKTKDDINLILLRSGYDSESPILTAETDSESESQKKEKKNQQAKKKKNQQAKKEKLNRTRNSWSKGKGGKLNCDDYYDYDDDCDD